MKIKSYFFLAGLFFLIVILLESCSSRYENYYDEEMVFGIKKIKRNKNFIYLEHKIPKSRLEKKELFDYLNEPTKLVFRKASFKNNEVTFALAGKSTTNFGYLNLLKTQEVIAIDSAACRYGDFLFLKLKPIQKGKYKIKSSGCRYYSEFEITIK